MILLFVMLTLISERACNRAPGLSQMCTGVKIGDLPTYFDGVRGELYVENEYTFCIRNFSYDGLGPGKP